MARKILGSTWGFDQEDFSGSGQSDMGGGNSYEGNGQSPMVGAGHPISKFPQTKFLV
jgi:hypothetical protein